MHQSPFAPHIKKVEKKFIKIDTFEKSVIFILCKGYKTTLK